VFRVNFTQSGNYSVFTDQIPGITATSLLLGTNLTNAVLVNRGMIDFSFYPIASQKSFAPILFVPSIGIQNLYLWQGIGISKIKTIVLFKTDSLAPLILNDPSTTVSSYNRFTTQHTFPKPGVSLVNLFWRNSNDMEQFFNISGSIPFASVERGAINAFHPSGLVCLFKFQEEFSTKLFHSQYLQTFHSHNTMELFHFIVELEFKDFLQIKQIQIFNVKLQAWLKEIIQFHCM
jgi:hypothetical protein